jgi:sugar transferase (PEP-CTERM/EpsH1 system associated)
MSLVHDEEEASHAGELGSLVRSVRIARVNKLPNAVRSAMALPSSTPLTHTMLHSSATAEAIAGLVNDARPDLVFCYCTGVGPLIDLPVLKGIPVVLDMVDVDSEKWTALSKTASSPMRWIYGREARVLSRFESAIANRVCCTLVVTERERAALLRLAPHARVEVIGNGVDAGSYAPPDAPVDRPAVVFCGVMNYEPNVEGAVWLGREVWPVVRQRRPDAILEIVGSNPTSKVQSLQSAEHGITVTGAVPDVRSYLWNAAVAAAPLLTARGVQNKVLEAVAAGLPVVVTPAVSAGLPVEVMAACKTAEDPAGFASAIIQLLSQPPSGRRNLAASTDIHSLTWTNQLSPLRDTVSGCLNRKLAQRLP